MHVSPERQTLMMLDAVIEPLLPLCVSSGLEVAVSGSYCSSRPATLLRTHERKMLNRLYREKSHAAGGAMISSGSHQESLAGAEGMIRSTKCTARIIAQKIAANAPMANFAIIQGLPRIADQDAATGLFSELLMATVAQNEEEAKERLRNFIERKADKVARPQ